MALATKWSIEGHDAMTGEDFADWCRRMQFNHIQAAAALNITIAEVLSLEQMDVLPRAYVLATDYLEQDVRHRPLRLVTEDCASGTCH